MRSTRPRATVLRPAGPGPGRGDRGHGDVSPAPGRAAEFPTFRAQEIDPHVGNVCYAVTTADVNGDGKLDVVAVTEDAVVWFANPGWEKHTIIKGATERDNVCIQAHDIDGDGRVDFALGAAGSRPTPRPAARSSGSAAGRRRRRALAGHPDRRRADPAPDPLGRRAGQRQEAAHRRPAPGPGDEGAELGRGQRRAGPGLQRPRRPGQGPLAARGRRRLAAHDPQPPGRSTSTATARTRSCSRPGRASSCSTATRAAAGRRPSSARATRTSKPSKGSSEVKVGRLADGRRYIATIEPWHGFQVVVYTPPASGQGLWDRRVVDEPVQWGHAVWCADLDGDGDQELIIGQRDKSNDPNREPKGPGVLVYDPKPGARPRWPSPGT